MDDSGAVVRWCEGKEVADTGVAEFVLEDRVGRQKDRYRIPVGVFDRKYQGSLRPNEEGGLRWKAQVDGRWLRLTGKPFEVRLPEAMDTTSSVSIRLESSSLPGLETILALAPQSRITAAFDVLWIVPGTVVDIFRQVPGEPIEQSYQSKQSGLPLSPEIDLSGAWTQRSDDG